MRYTGLAGTCSRPPPRGDATIVKHLPGLALSQFKVALSAPRVRALLLALAALAVGAALWLHAVWPLDASGAAGYDFFKAYLPGAQAVAAGANPYHQLVQQTSDTQPGDTGLHAHGYVYPPLLAVVLALPLRLGLSPVALWLLWNLANVAAVLWMGRELTVALRGRSDWAGSLAFAAATLLGAVATYDLSLGQADLLMAALVVGACGLWLRRNPWAGLVLGAAIAIKPTMALVLLVWLWKGDWHAALRGALAALALVVVPFLLLGWEALRDYLTFFVQWNAFQANAEYINQSPYGMLLRLFTVNSSTRPLFVAPWLVQPLRLLVAGAAVAWWLRAVPRGRTVDAALAMGECLLALPLILLVSPLAEDIHYCILLPTLVGLSWFAWSRGLTRLPAAWVLWASLAIVCLPRMQELIYPDHLLLLPGQTDPHIGWLIALVRTGTLLYVALAALLAGGVVLRAARDVSPSRPDPSVAPTRTTPPLPVERGGRG
jgi:hypothetical protein